MGIGEANAKKAGGVVYTPQWLADLVIEQAPASALFSGACADISCGEGAFLLRLCHRAWGEIQKTSDGQRERQERFRAWAEGNLWGSDVDKAALARARVALDEFALSRTELGGVKWRLHERDALGERLLGELKGKCSLMAGNPPYVRIQNLPPATREAAQRLSFCAQGSTDLYLAFYEIGLACLAPGGVLSFVAPNSWTRAKAGAAMRKSLSESGQLTRLIDFRDWPPFEGVGAYCAVAVMEQAGGRQEFEYFEWDQEKKAPVRVGMARASGLAGALPMPALLARGVSEAGVMIREPEAREAGEGLWERLAGAMDKAQLEASWEDLGQEGGILAMAGELDEQGVKEAMRETPGAYWMGLRSALLERSSGSEGGDRLAGLILGNMIESAGQSEEARGLLGEHLWGILDTEGLAVWALKDARAPLEVIPGLDLPWESSTFMLSLSMKSEGIAWAAPAFAAAGLGPEQGKRSSAWFDGGLEARAKAAFEGVHALMESRELKASVEKGRAPARRAGL